MCNGILSGLVSVTGSCGNINNGYAIIIGFFGGVFYTFAAKLVAYLKIDDPLDAFSVHGVCGIWGVINVGLFDKTYGLFYGNGFH